MIESVSMLAQRDADWSNLMYLLLVLVLPALNELGKWLRKRSAAKNDKAKANSLDTARMPSARPAAGIPVAPPARPARRAGAPVTEAGPEQSPEIVVAEVLDSLFPSHRKPPTAPGVVVERVEPAVFRRAQEGPVPPPRRPSGRPSRPPTRAAVPRARRTKARSPAEEVRALKKTMEHQPEADLTLRHSVAWGDWTSLSIAELRRAIVLNEVLEPPIALRRAPIGPRW